MSGKGKQKDGKEKILRAAIKRRVAKDERAFRIVEKMVLKESVDQEFFVNAAMFITLSQYKDVIEERGITKLCGYPLCNNKLIQVLKQKYKISLREKKVYDVTERKNFCSNLCYKASKYYESQLLADPVWMRDDKPSLQLKLLDENKDAKHSLSGSGEEIDISTNIDMHPSGDEVQETSKLCVESTQDEMVDVRSVGTDKDHETDNVNDIFAGSNFCIDDDDDNDDINRLDDDDDQMERDTTYAIRHSDDMNIDSDDNDQYVDDDIDDDYDYDNDDDDHDNDDSDNHGNNDDSHCDGDIKSETSSKRKNLPTHQNTSNLLIQTTERPGTSNLLIQTTEKPGTSNLLTQTTERPGTSNLLTQTTERSGTSNLLTQTTERPGTSNLLTQSTERPGTSNLLTQTTERPSTSNLLTQTTERPGTSNLLTQSTERPGTSNLLTQTTERPGTSNLLTQTTERPSTSNLLTQTTERPGTSNLLTQTTERPGISNLLTQTTERPGTSNLLTQTTERPGTSNLLTQTTERPGTSNLLTKTTERPGTSNLLIQTTERPGTSISTDHRTNTTKGTSQKHELNTRGSQTTVSSKLNQTTNQYSLNDSGISIAESKASSASNYAVDECSKENKTAQDIDQKTVDLTKDESSEALQSVNQIHLESKVATGNYCIGKLDHVVCGASSRYVDLENHSGDRDQELKRNHCVEVVCQTLLGWCSAETRSYCVASRYSQDTTEEADTPKFLEEREIVSDGKGQVSEEHKTTGKTFFINKKMSLPFIDSKSPMTIRGKIVSEKLTKALLPMLSRLGISFADVSSDVTNILKTFKFTNTNIILKPSEWTLVALTVLLTLMRCNSTVKGLLFARQKDLHLLLNEIAISEDDLDRLVTILIPNKDFSLTEPASISDQRESNMEELD